MGEASIKFQQLLVDIRFDAYTKSIVSGGTLSSKTMRLERLWMEAQDNLRDLSIPKTEDPERHFERTIRRGQRTQAFLKAEAAFIVYNRTKHRSRGLRERLRHAEDHYRKIRLESHAIEKFTLGLYGRSKLATKSRSPGFSVTLSQNSKKVDDAVTCLFGT